MLRRLSVPGILALTLQAQEWPHYGGDAGGMRYSPLKQISKSNVARLKVAWTFHTGDVSDGTTYPQRSAFEATPLVVDGVMYVTTPFSRLIALDPETGKQLWAFDPKINMERPSNLFINRGAAYWTDGRNKRLFLGTLDGRLFAIDAASGEGVESFGKAGFINLREGVADRFPNKGYGMTSPAAIYKNLVICGAMTADGEPQGPAGDVRAFDALTGRLVWTFHTVPHAGEFGNDTWESDAWKDRAAANAWSILSVDVERGMVFLPLTSPASDYYGGDRKGANLFGDSLVALDAATGKRLWHFQTVHHNIWDYDLPAQPTLVTVTRNGKDVPAVAQVTKTGFTFVFYRLTGKPLFDIEERPVPKSEVAGEATWPTQPHPVKPPPYARQSFSRDELTDVTPESRTYCSKLIEGAAFGTLFTPISLKPTVLFPGTNGGANWGGASFDEATGRLYVSVNEEGAIGQMQPTAAESALPYRRTGGSEAEGEYPRFRGPNGWPCQAPPWGTLTGVNLGTGERVFRVPLGEIEALTRRGVPKTGTQSLGGGIVTAGGLVFIGATVDKRFRAFDAQTGEELWSAALPANAHATPATYEGRSGRQYVVVAAGGGGFLRELSADLSDTLVAFALPVGTGKDQGPRH
jgi:quinoprotein glucose dehydrogenase